MARAGLLAPERRVLSPTHASLNHHAAEAEFLYRMADAVNEDSYAVLADRMVRGIEQSELLWYKPDGDLNYSYKPDGTCSGQDYPYLTYNDLLELQRLYAARHGQEKHGDRPFRRRVQADLDE